MAPSAIFLHRVSFEDASLVGLGLHMKGSVSCTRVLKLVSCWFLGPLYGDSRNGAIPRKGGLKLTNVNEITSTACFIGTSWKELHLDSCSLQVSNNVNHLTPPQG